MIIVTHSNSQVTIQNVVKIIARGVLIRVGCWKHVKNLISRGMAIRYLTSDPTVIATIFNKFFVTVSHDITKKVPRSNKSPVTFMSDRVGNSVFIALQFPLPFLI